MASASPSPDPRPGERFIFNRPPRVRPRLPDREVAIAAPPAAGGRPPPINLIAVATPALLMAVSAITFLQFGGGNQTLLLLGLGATIAVTALGTLASLLWDRRLQRRDEAAQLADYARVLDEQERELTRLEEEQRRIRQDNDPDLPVVITRARRREDRLWERRPADDDFLRLRLGVGELPASVGIVPPPVDRLGPHVQRARRLAETYAIVRDVPVTTDLRAVGSVGVAGPSDAAIRLLRAMLLHLAVQHAPDEVRLAAVLPESAAAEWAWLAGLPHTRPLQPDSRGDLVATTPEAAERVLGALLDELSRREPQRAPTGEVPADRPQGPHVVLLIVGRDRPVEHVAVDYLLRRGRAVGASVIHLVGERGDIPGEAGAIVEIVGGAQANYAVAGAGGEARSCIPDAAGPEDCRHVTEALRGGRLRGRRGADDLPSDVRLLALLAIAPRTWDPDAAWRRPSFGPFAVPLGVQPGGAPLVLDLLEHGPHGLIAGTTGSGKSELLQTLIVGLALTHDPQRLSFVLVDYKGGGSLNVFRDLPHNVGLITNLQGRLAERALTAFDAELKRRQRLFAEAEVQNLPEYRRRRPEAVLPNLVIVIDEFAELARELPDFMVRLISIAQTGRTLGIHLLLATQRPAGVVNANIWANTRFRICLRVESLEDSREVLGRPDAALLPHNRPGRGYFQVGQDIFKLFQVARVAATYEGELPAGLTTDDAGAEPVDGRPPDPMAAPPLPADPSDAQAMVALLARHARAQGLDRLRGPWSEPLAARVALPAVLDRLGWPEAEAMRRSDDWRWPAPSQERWLQAPIGLLDDIAAQEHRPLVLDFQREGTHLLVAGSAGAGKSTLVRTLITSLALTHDPASLSFYLVDFGGQALAPLADLPHVGGFFRPNEAARIQRLLRRLSAELVRRKTLLGEAHAPNLWRLRQSAGGERLPALMVVIDNFAGFREGFEDDLPTLATIAREGRAVGLHLVLTLDRPSALPSSLYSNIELRLALRLADPLESSAVLGKADATELDADAPGRGFLPGRPSLEFQAALPAATPDEEAQAAALAALAGRMRRAWAGAPRPEPIELLPTHAPLAELLAAPPDEVIGGGRGRLPMPLALDDQQLRPVAVDLEQDGPHMLVTGIAGSGKSVALRAWALALAERATPDQAQLALIGLRRSLRPLRRLPHLVAGGYVENAAQLDELTEWLLAEARRRQALAREFFARDEPAAAPPPWPALVIVVDDCETILSAAADAAGRLADIAKGGRDLGLHLIVAGGVEEMKNSYQPLVEQLRAGRTGVLLRVNDPADGLVLGVRLPYNLQAGDYPPGRGHLVTTAGSRLVQLAIGDGAEHEPGALAGWVDRIVERAAGAGRGAAAR